MADEADRIVEELIWLGLPIKHKDAATRRVRGFATASAEAMREAAGEMADADELDNPDPRLFTPDGTRMALGNAIRALPAEAASPQWRPIAEAPKDGTPILIARYDATFGWARGWGTWEDIKGISGWCCRGGFYEVPGTLGLGHPTHWQPIPASPPKPPVEVGA